MKKLSKAIALLLSIVIALSSLTVFGEEATNVEKYVAYDLLQDEKELSTPDDNKMCLVENGQTDFSIVVSDDIDENLQDAVNILKEAIYSITGAEFKENSNNIIEIGLSNKPTSDVGDGYRIVIDDSKITICGEDADGTRNGVYDFCEEQLGAMFLTEDDTYYPSVSSIYLEKIDREVKPAMAWRDYYNYESVQNYWGAKLKLNGVDISKSNTSSVVEDKQHKGWGTWCHSCYEFLSPDEYFESHPEYFSELNGKRITEYKDRDAYLCLSNPEVLEIVKENMRKLIDANPDVDYWDFSGSDNPYLAGCQCDTCKKLDEEAGGTGMGTLLPFINELAKEFPDKYISTLAYLHTVNAPVNIKAEPNVVIKLCAMPGDQRESYLNGSTSGAKDFREQVQAWGKVASRIVVWDYVVNFSNLLLTFPNFECQNENEQFYEENNVIGIFHQASREKGSEMAELRAYVLSKLMWQGSELDVDRLIEKYIAGYYGNYQEPVLEYMNKAYNGLYNSEYDLGLYDGLAKHYKDGYLSESNVLEYDSIITKALNQAKDNGDDIYCDRIEELKINTTFNKTLLPNIDSDERDEYSKELKSLCDKHNVTMTCEWQSLEDYLSYGMKDAVKSELKEINKTRNNIIIGVCSTIGGIVLLTVCGVTIKKVIKRKKKGKSQ